MKYKTKKFSYTNITIYCQNPANPRYQNQYLFKTKSII